MWSKKNLESLPKSAKSFRNLPLRSFKTFKPLQQIITSSTLLSHQILIKTHYHIMSSKKFWKFLFKKSAKDRNKDNRIETKIIERKTSCSDKTFCCSIFSLIVKSETFK